MSAASEANFWSVTADGKADQESLRKTIQEIKDRGAVAVEYVPDTGTPVQSRVGLDMRIARVTCSTCLAHTEKHQSKAKTSDEWPDTLRELEIFGWISAGARWFCGKTCHERYLQHMRNHNDMPLPVAPAHPGYHRELYAAQSRRTVDPPHPSDITPAVPVVHGRKR